MGETEADEGNQVSLSVHSSVEQTTLTVNPVTCKKKCTFDISNTAREIMTVGLEGPLKGTCVSFPAPRARTEWCSAEGTVV